MIVFSHYQRYIWVPEPNPTKAENNWELMSNCLTYGWVYKITQEAFCSVCFGYKNRAARQQQVAEMHEHAMPRPDIREIDRIYKYMTIIIEYHEDLPTRSQSHNEWCTWWHWSGSPKWWPVVTVIWAFWIFTFRLTQRINREKI